MDERRGGRAKCGAMTAYCLLPTADCLLNEKVMDSREPPGF